MLDPIAPFCLIIVEQIDLADVIRLLRRGTEGKVIRDLCLRTIRRGDNDIIRSSMQIDPDLQPVFFILRKLYR